MSAYSMASMPHSLQPLSRASELPRVHSTKTWLIHWALAIVIANPSPFCESGTHAWIWISISSYPKRYSFVMPDLLWSGWVCLATPTLPPDVSGSLLAATVTPSALPVLQPHFSSHLPLPVAGPSRQGAHA